ncbi:ABC transporter permease [Sporosarcina sp. FSL K6-1522]|uniref:ABC transporter permease n=1 Tax=Sporosarcina sp. FSL K6-1522 TaxID=2921554 RepID=UPI003159FCA7
MKVLLATRLMRWKKEWKSLLCWLLLPIVLTLFVLQSVDIWQAETKVPIALVVEEQTDMAAHLVEAIAETELLHIEFMELEDALHKLEQHELDSVFVIRQGYEESILSGRRNQLIEAYSSNRSFAYQAVVETVTSFAQQDAARSKAAFVIKALFETHHMEEKWSYTKVIDSSRERQREEALLQSSFTYYDKSEDGVGQALPLLQVWGVWALFAMLTTFFLFDWMLKENRPSMQPRWAFTTLSFNRYALGTFALYTVLLVVVDLLTAVIFQEKLTQLVLALVAFRFTINLCAFLLATVYRQLFFYYISGVALTLLLVVVGGAIVPVEGLARKWPWIEVLSPVHALLTGTVSVPWLAMLLFILVLWLWKGRKSYA